MYYDQKKARNKNPKIFAHLVIYLHVKEAKSWLQPKIRIYMWSILGLELGSWHWYYEQSTYFHVRASLAVVTTCTECLDRAHRGPVFISQMLNRRFSLVWLRKKYLPTTNMWNILRLELRSWKRDLTQKRLSSLYPLRCSWSVDPVNPRDWTQRT